MRPFLKKLIDEFLFLSKWYFIAGVFILLLYIIAVVVFGEEMAYDIAVEILEEIRKMFPW